MNVCRGQSEVFDIFLIIPYKMQTCCVPSLFKTLKTFSGAECLQDKVQAPKCGFIISRFLRPPAFSSRPASTPSPLPPQGSALLLAPLQVALPDAHVCQVLLAGETGASQASCHRPATWPGSCLLTWVPTQGIQLALSKELMREPVHNSNIEGILSIL